MIHVEVQVGVGPVSTAPGDIRRAVTWGCHAQPHVRKVGLARRKFKVGAALCQQCQIWTGNVIG